MQPDPPMIELPPLPDPDGSIEDAEDELFTPVALRSYGEACARAALEAAAQACEQRAGSMSMFARASDARENAATVRGCAAAIRALMERP